MKPRFLHNTTRKGFVFFHRDVTAFNEVSLNPLFSVTKYHEKR